MGTPRYSREFKAEAVRLFKAGNKPVSQLAKELGVAAKSIRDWARQAEADAGTGVLGVLTTPEREELSALRRKIVNSKGNGIFCNKRRHTSRGRRSEVSLHLNEDRPVSRGLDVSPFTGFSFGLLCFAYSQAECSGAQR